MFNLCAGNAPVCGWKDRIECSEEMVKQFKTNALSTNCSCPRQCAMMDYTYSVSASEMSDLSLDWIIEKNNLGANESKSDFRLRSAVLQVRIIYRLSKQKKRSYRLELPDSDLVNTKID